MSEKEILVDDVNEIEEDDSINSCEDIEILRAFEREVAIGWISSDDYISVDIDYGKDNNKYIKLCDEAVAEGKGKLITADSCHKTYHIDKGYFKFFVKKGTKNFSEEQKEALKERMSNMRRNKKAL